LGSGTVSDPFVVAALWVGCGAFAASFSILVAVALMRARLVRRTAREQRLAEQWNPLIAQCAEAVPPHLPPIADRDAERVLMLWTHAQEVLRGEAQQNLVELARRCGFRAHVERLLRAGRPRQELLALVVLGHLRSRSRIPLLERLVVEASSLVSLTAAHALLRIDESRGIACLVAAAARREDWALAQIVAILKDADPARVGMHLVAAIRGERRSPTTGPGLAQLVRLHGTAHAEALRPAVLEVLNAPADAEVLAAALGALWHPADVLHVRAHLSHPDWVVRVAAAHALKRLGEREDLPRLSHLLGDGNWWVRHRAAQALCALPGVALEELRQLRGSLTDRYAADALGQALADRAA